MRPHYFLPEPAKARHCKTPALLQRSAGACGSTPRRPGWASRVLGTVSRSTPSRRFVIARENRDGSLMFNFVPTRRRGAYMDNQRTGFLLYRKANDDAR